MRLLHLPLSLFVISLLGYGTASGQERPDFTGTWVMDMNRSETAGQAPELLRQAPVTLIIAQSPDELIIETEANGRRESVTYSFARRLDPPRPVGTMGSNDSTVQEARAEWKGDRLETSAVLSVNGQAVTKAVSRTLDPSGGEYDGRDHIGSPARLRTQWGKRWHGQGRVHQERAFPSSAMSPLAPQDGSRLVVFVGRQLQPVAERITEIDRVGRCVVDRQVRSYTVTAMIGQIQVG